MPSELADLLHSVRRTIDWHRRTIAAVLAGVAVLASLSALSPRHPPTRAVWAAAHDLAGGAPIRTADVVLTRIPLAIVPTGALDSGSPVVGRLLAAPVRRGEPLTDVRLLGPSLLAALGRPGQVAVPVRLADGAAAAAIARPGEVVDVLAVGSLDEANGGSDPTVVAPGVTVLAVPGHDGTSGSDAGSSDGGGSDAGLVVVAVTPAAAAALAVAATRSRLSLVLRRP
jgi:Flp pilus assembly protein CpaB